MTLQTSVPIVNRSQANQLNRLQALAEFRQTWERIAEGESLLNITVPVGLMLFDVADRLALTPEERLLFLGELLIDDIERFGKQQVEQAK
ncbi:MAG: hypothetical protein WBW94_08220 [Anaerolineales bacterium]